MFGSKCCLARGGRTNSSKMPGVKVNTEVLGSGVGIASETNKFRRRSKMDSQPSRVEAEAVARPIVLDVASVEREVERHFGAVRGHTLAATRAADAHDQPPMKR